MSTASTTCYDEGPSIKGQLYTYEGTESLRTETTPEPLVISEGSVLTSGYRVGPSLLLSEVEGPLQWPIVSVAGTGPTYKLN